MSNPSYPRSTTANTTVAPFNGTVKSTEPLQTTNASKHVLGTSNIMFIFLGVLVAFYIIITSIYILCIKPYAHENDTVRQVSRKKSRRRDRSQEVVEGMQTSRKKSRRRERSQEVVEEVQIDLQEVPYEPRPYDYETVV